MRKPFPIYAKCAFREGQLKSKLDIGCDGIEYQMLDADFVLGSGKLVDRESIEKLISACPAYVIHPPMSTVNIEKIDGLEPARRETAMELAEISALETGKRAMVVAHIETHIDQLPRNTLLVLESELESAFNKYPHVDIAVENITPFNKFVSKSSAMSSGYYDAPVKFVERFKRYADAGRLGVCLDICHALMTKYYLEPIFELYGEAVFDVSMRNYFDMYAEYLKLIHLASYSGNGYGLGCHAVAFGDKPGDREILEEILDLYANHFPKGECPVTIEVNETDYFVSSEYEKTRDFLLDVFNDDEKKRP